MFLFAHFGKHLHDGYRLVRDVYGSLGGQPWTWERTSTDPKSFRRWLSLKQEALRSDGIRRRFGNHRKYESLDGSSSKGTGHVVETYVNWVKPSGSHEGLFGGVIERVGGDRRRAFGALYQLMDAVARFGRTGRFDYLAMIGKLGLAAIEPDSAYISESTGPLTGARLLFGGRFDAPLAANTLDQWLLELDSSLEVGMQALEDAICNWQKSPTTFKRFRG